MVTDRAEATTDRSGTDPFSQRLRPLPGTALCMALVALAMIFGGGGSVNPQTEMVLQVSTALVAFPLVVLPDWQRGLAPIPREAWLLAVLVLIIPAFQLIPLPPSIWHNLPGRSLEIQALARAQADQRWMPLSLAPARTFASLLAMMCPALLLLQVSRLSLQGRNWVCVAIVGVGLLSLIVGVLQLSHSGGLDWSFYREFHYGYLIGFQANRNAETDVLQIAALALGALFATRLGDGRRHTATWAGLVLGILAFLLGVFLTGSRAGITLAPLMLMVLAVMLWPVIRSWKHALLWLGGITAGVAGAGATIWQLAAVRKVIDRFSIVHDSRPDLWADTLYSIHQVWPFGSGVGTIVPMLQLAERLEVVDPSMPVRSHNDWLEWTLEGGLPGLVVLLAIAVVITVLLIRAAIASYSPRRNLTRQTHAVFATGVLLVSGLHGIVDYPMRSMSIAALTAVAAAFLTGYTAAQRKQEPNGPEPAEIMVLRQ